MARGNTIRAARYFIAPQVGDNDADANEPGKPGAMPKRIPTHKPAGYKGEEQRRKEADTKRDQEKPWRAWYRTQRWKALRAIRLAMDPWCVRCIAADRPLTPSDTVNHKDPHKGDPVKFWDLDNTEGVCTPCHSGEIQREERAAEDGRES